MGTEESPKGLFAADVTRQMRRRRMAVSDLASTAELSVRRVESAASGETLPDGNVALHLCRALKIDFDKARVEIALDKIQRKFGPIFWKVVSSLPNSRDGRQRGSGRSFQRVGTIRKQKVVTKSGTPLDAKSR